jgi:hypothetical protein
VKSGIDSGIFVPRRYVMPLRIPFAERRSDGRYVDAGSVPSGLACDCVCPECGDGLIARHARKSKRASHFAHSSEIACEKAFETALHKTAKQILADEFEIALNFGQSGLRHAIAWEESHIEKAVRDFKPDVLTRHSSGNQIAFEILVTHEVDLVKQEKIRQAKLTCFEIDLSKVRRLITYENLRRGICEGKYHCRIVHDEFLDFAERLEAELAFLRPQKYRALVKRRQKEKERQAAAQKKQHEWRQKMPWLS